MMGEYVLFIMRKYVLYVFFFVYYEPIKRELKIKPIYECRCAERLQTKTKRFTHLLEIPIDKNLLSTINKNAY